VAGEFHAFGRVRRFEATAAFWEQRDDGLLFAFHLHGFEELARYAAGVRTPAGDAFWQSVLASWLREARPPARPAWHPFPTSRRIVGWGAALSAGVAAEPLAGQLRASLWRQARYLTRVVEHDIGGNHVVANAWASAQAFATTWLPPMSCSTTRVR